VAIVLILAVLPVEPVAATVDDASTSSAAKSRISGVVRWADGRPVVDPQINLHRWNQDGNGWREAERVTAIDADGNFAFEDLPADQYCCVAVRVPGAGLALRQISTEAGETAKVRVTLRPAVKSFVTVRDDQGRPLDGARFRSWEIVDGTEGTCSLRRGGEPGLGLPVAISDESGRLAFPELPQGAILKRMHIDHPRFAAALLGPEQSLKAGEIATCHLQAGFPLRLQFVQPDEGHSPPDLSEISLRLWHKDLRHADSILSIPFPVKDGYVEQQLQPGEFQLLDMQSERYLFTPWVHPKDRSRLRFTPGEHDQWTFRALPKVLVRGRVLKGNGNPLPKATLGGSIENLLGDGTRVPDNWYAWVSTEFADTDEDGEYRIHLAPGRGRIEYLGDGIPSVDHWDVTIEGTKEQRMPDIVVRDLPAIRGEVLGLDGQPATQTVVRAFSDSNVRYITKPVLTDGKGRFEIPLTSMPVNLKTETPLYVHQVFAYAPYESVGGVATIDLHDQNAVGEVRIPMTKQPADWPLSEMRVAFSERERGEPDEQFRRDWMKPENAVGSAVPELDGALWLHTDKQRLADFRGQFVFLDFYTTWCGPCRADFPTVKMVYDLYRHRGVTVIAVHDNSSAHDVIREHAAEKGMEMPIVVDKDDGRILKAYEALWLASGYPSYLLLNPEGRLVTSDRCTPGPTLRLYKVELVRQLLLQHSTQ
jgi:thiol-disulfide isomerase/thioredoxin